MKIINLLGKTFGNLLVLRRIGSRNNKSLWECQCSCGSLCNVTSDSLNCKKTKSCGCLKSQLQSQRAIKRNTLHGHNKAGKGNQSPTWNSWRCMLKRCNNPKHISYPSYGGRGIRVCSDWKEFKNFLKDMGERPYNKTIDRVNVNGNYEKPNCKWSTRSEQQKNKRCHTIEKS